MEVIKLPSLKCELCGSYKVILVEDTQECDDCMKVTAQTSDFIKKKRTKFRNLTTKLGDI